MAEEVIFVDTGAWVALADESDQYHKEAASVYPVLLKKYRRLVTTNLVIAESYILIRRSLGYKAAITFLEKTSTSPRIQKIYSNEKLENEGEDILRQFNDQDFSYTDAVSFAVMRQISVEKAFAFDQHFSTAGFLTVP